MVMRGKHEADAQFIDALRDHSRREVEVDAQRLKDICRADPRGDCAVAMFGDRDTRGCADERHSGRDIEGPGSIATRATGVHDA